MIECLCFELCKPNKRSRFNKIEVKDDALQETVL